MTDKVQKIRNEVERLQNELIQEREKSYGSDVDDFCILELENVLTYIDSLQEEPVKDRLAFKAIPRLLDMIEPSERAKNYVTKLADAFDAEGYHTDAKIVRESLKIMNGEKVPMATMDEETISEDLGEYLYELSKRYPEVSFAKLSRIGVRVAKWQREHLRNDKDRTMGKAEKFISEHTRNCSNIEYTKGYYQFYHPWLTPDQARRAVEIAREETLLEVAAWISDTFIFSKHAKEDFCQTFNIKKELL